MFHHSLSPQYSLPSLSPVVPAGWDAPHLGEKCRQPGRSSRRRLHLLCQDLFADALRREQKRADRYEQQFVLLLVDTHSVPSRRAIAAVRDAVLASGLEGVVFGWHTATTLGVILPEAGDE